MTAGVGSTVWSDGLRGLQDLASGAGQASLLLGDTTAAAVAAAAAAAAAAAVAAEGHS